MKFAVFGKNYDLKYRNIMDRRDIHVLKYFSSYVSVSGGKVIDVTEPTLKFCPLAGHLYDGLRGRHSSDKEAVKAVIREAIESKIKDYGFFTGKRKFIFNKVSIPYGASEMLGFALRKKTIDAAVVVCEGAGTVITDNPDMVQGIGARMNSLTMTSPIKEIIERLRIAGCRVVFEDAVIDQVRGVEKAMSAGYKNIAVTVCGHSAEDLKKIRLLEKESSAKVVILSVCTTEVTQDEAVIIGEYADLVWSCASADIRRIAGPLAKIQLSLQIPVFVLTSSGVNFVSAYAKESEMIQSLDQKKQFLFSAKSGAQCAHMGDFKVFIKESALPVDARRKPGFDNNA